MLKRVTMRQRLLIVLIGFVGYAYAGYPLLLLILNRIRSRPIVKGPIELSYSIIVPAHNESQILPQKLESILNQDYPPSLVEVLVASDGSTDDSSTIVAA